MAQAAAAAKNAKRTASPSVGAVLACEEWNVRLPSRCARCVWKCHGYGRKWCRVAAEKSVRSIVVQTVLRRAECGSARALVCGSRVALGQGAHVQVDRESVQNGVREAGRGTTAAPLDIVGYHRPTCSARTALVTAGCSVLEAAGCRACVLASWVLARHPFALPLSDGTG